MAECPASIVLRSEGVESSNIEKESGEKLLPNLQKLFESELSESCVPSLETVDPRANSKSDEKESDEKLADNPQKFSESCVPCKGPFDPKANLKWEVGSHCKAVWSQDGRVYPATLVWLEGERCKVKFDNYGNEEEMDLSAMLPEAADQPRKEKRSDEKESDEKLADNPQKLMELKLSESDVPNKGPVHPKANSKVWMLGSRCRAVYSEDGLVYPAVLVWMRGERCRVKFEGYGNEEELELSSLLLPDDLGRHCGRATAKAVEGFRSTSNNSSDWKKDREWRTPQQEGREEPSSPRPLEFPPGKGYNLGNEQGDKKKPSSQKEEPNGRIREPNDHPFPFFPPVPPPNGSLDFLSLLPPPPPPPCVWPPRAGLVDAGDGLDSAVTDLSSMLLSWYLCGYHTGCYMAMQQTAASRKRAHKEKRAEE
ncbi:survival motor neuron protein 1 isoform X1 [Salmo trutta]|uniref:survival motor neuron protein 1 isoform X1 n=1 Tax=Salmo trutta TaxID=8032 RepID=UPI001130D7DE|nr:survival motor neuron protein 1-like isoform X1 [Salmo trutta]